MVLGASKSKVSSTTRTKTAREVGQDRTSTEATQRGHVRHDTMDGDTWITNQVSCTGARGNDTGKMRVQETENQIEKLTELWHLYIRRVHPNPERGHPCREVRRVDGDHICPSVRRDLLRPLLRLLAPQMSPDEVDREPAQDERPYDRKRDAQRE